MACLLDPMIREIDPFDITSKDNSSCKMPLPGVLPFSFRLNSFSGLAPIKRLSLVEGEGIFHCQFKESWMSGLCLPY